MRQLSSVCFPTSPAKMEARRCCPLYRYARIPVSSRTKRHHVNRGCERVATPRLFVQALQTEAALEDNA